MKTNFFSPRMVALGSLALCASMFACEVMANPVLWTVDETNSGGSVRYLQDVFGDGNYLFVDEDSISISGSFIYDADFNALSGIQITIDEQNLITGQSTGPMDASLSGDSNIFNFLFLQTTLPIYPNGKGLTNAGGYANYVGIDYFNFFNLKTEVYVSLSLKGETLPVPEPETYALLLAGLGMTGWAARRKNIV